VFPGPASQDDVGLQTDQLVRERSYPIDVTAGPPKVNPRLAAIGPTRCGSVMPVSNLYERGVATLPVRIIIFVVRHEHADPPHAVALLCPRHHGPRRRARQSRDELPPSHLSSPRLIGGAYRGAGCKGTGCVTGCVAVYRWFGRRSTPACASGCGCGSWFAPTGMPLVGGEAPGPVLRPGSRRGLTRAGRPRRPKPATGV
jgi:hypothetical protein